MLDYAGLSTAEPSICEFKDLFYVQLLRPRSIQTSQCASGSRKVVYFPINHSTTPISEYYTVLGLFLFILIVKMLAVFSDSMLVINKCLKIDFLLTKVLKTHALIYLLLTN